MRVLVILLLLAGAAGAEDALSLRAERDFGLTADPDSSPWQGAPAVVFSHGRYGQPIPGHRTEVRSRWTPENLYLLFICPYENLFLKPGSPAQGETNGLWNWDVAETFIGWDFDHIHHYREFEVSPRGEWVDLAIGQQPDGAREAGWEWDSGFECKTRIDAERKIWYGEMRIPMKSIAPWTPEAGRALRVNLYRAQGQPRQYLTWRPVGQDSFHKPEAFGRLVLSE